MKKLKAFPKPSSRQPVNPNIVCELGRILDLFHEDLHRADERITDEQDAESFAVFQEIVTNYMPHLAPAQWIAVLGDLVVGMYINPSVVAARSRATSPFAVSA
jgi:hypothetical protein